MAPCRGRCPAFLDVESRHLGLLPGLAEDRLADLAARAGVTFRAYVLTTGGAVSSDKLCEVLFPRSARRQRVLPPLSEAVEFRLPSSEYTSGYGRIPRPDQSEGTGGAPWR